MVAPARGRACWPSCAELGIGFVPVQPARQGLPHRHRRHLDHLRRATTCGRRSPGSPARRWNTTSPWSTEVKAIAAAKGATPGQIALAWLLAQQPWIVPIPGTTKPHRLEENLAAADVTLTEAELSQLNELSSRIEIHGGRYPDDLEAQTNL